MEDLIEDEDLDIEDADEEGETPDPAAEKPPPAAEPDFASELTRNAEEKERARWIMAGADEQVREASLRAWEKERLADAEGREARLAPFDNRDPYDYRIDKRVPRVAPPKEKTAARYTPCTDALDDAETELTAVIAECRYFMREMVFESARTTPIVDDRIRFIESARSLAEVSAKVGASIGTVRNPLLAEPDEKKKKRARR
ncbi:MAG TPA: hypothetical protein VMF58_02385 [Rhizomicrobium sp.]|nr:hypothetical protein [Rhizomicrobium sp.]